MLDFSDEAQQKKLKAEDAEKLVRAIRKGQAEQVQAVILGFGDDAERFLNTPFSVDEGGRTNFLTEALNSKDALIVRLLLKGGAHPETRVNGNSGPNAFYALQADASLFDQCVQDIRRRHGTQADQVIHEAIVGSPTQETDSCLFLHADNRNNDQVLKLLALLPNESSRRQALEVYASPLGYRLDINASQRGRTLNPLKVFRLENFWSYDRNDESGMERKLHRMHYDIDHYDDRAFYTRPQPDRPNDTEVRDYDRTELMPRAPKQGLQRQSLSQLKEWLVEDEEQPVMPPPMAGRFLKLLPDLAVPKRERKIVIDEPVEETETIFPDEVDTTHIRASLRKMGKEAAAFLNTPIQREDGSRTMWLLEAVNAGNRELVELFLENGAKPTARTNGNTGPNAFYATNFDADITNLLFDNIKVKVKSKSKADEPAGILGEFARAKKVMERNPDSVGGEGGLDAEGVTVTPTSKYRSKEFEAALVDYEIQETGRRRGWETKDIVMHCVLEGSQELKKLDQFMQAKIGRGIEPGDFCFLSPEGTVEPGCSSLTFGEDVRRGTGTIVKFLKEKGLVFSAAALNLPAEWSRVHGTTPLKRIEDQGRLDTLFDADFWQVNAAPLQELLLTANRNVKTSIERCLAGIDRMHRETTESELEGKVTGFAAVQAFILPTEPEEEKPLVDLVDPAEQSRLAAFEGLKEILEGFGEDAATIVNSTIVKSDGKRVMLLTEVMNTRNPAAITLLLEHGADPTMRTEGKKGHNAFYATDSEPEYMSLLVDHIRATQADPDMAIHEAIVGGKSQKTDSCLFTHADVMNGHHVMQLIDLLPNESSKSQAMDIHISPRGYKLDADAQKEDTWFSITRCMNLQDFLNWRSRFSKGEESRWMDNLSDKISDMRGDLDEDDERFYYDPESGGDAEIRKDYRKQEEQRFDELREKEVQQQADYREKIKAEIDARTVYAEQIKTATATIATEKARLIELSAELEGLEQQADTNSRTITTLLERRQGLRQRLHGMRQQPAGVA